jgi:hypothetical protein
MATTYTSSLGLALPTTGELSGTWGDTVNNYLTTYVDTAVAGQLAISLTGDLSLSKTTGTSLGSTSSQYAILNVTPSASTWTITVPSSTSKTYVLNNLSSTYTFAFKASGGTAITVAAAEKCVVAYNGTDLVRISSTSVFGSPSTAMTLDTNGNLGLGVTPSAWGSGKKVLQIGTDLALFYNAANDSAMTVNVYNNGTNNIYLTSNYATNYRQNVGQHIWYTAPSGTAGNAITFTQAMTLDTSGMLGIGVTPSAWNQSGYKALEIGVIGNGINSGLNDISVFANVYYNTTLKYATSGYAASYYVQNAGAHKWFNAPSGTAGNTITFTQAMTLDASGNLGIGTTSVTNGAGWDKLVQIYATNYPVLSLKNSYRQWDTTVYGSSGALVFYDATAAAERMRLNSSGNLGLGVTPSAWGSTKKVLQIGADGTLFYNNTNDFIMGLNYYTDGSNNNIFIANGIASAYRQNSGIHAWYYSNSGTAGGTPTFTQAMTLDASGNLGIGTTSPAKRLDIRQAYTSDTVVFQIGNTNNGNGATPVSTVFDFTEANGTPVSRISSIYTQSAGTTSLAFGTYGSSSLSEKMRLDSSGNLGIGNTTILAPLSLPDTIGTAGSINRIQLYQSGGVTDYGFGISSAQLNYMSGNSHVFYKKSGGTSTEYMRLDASGNLLVNTATLTSAGISTSGTFQVNTECMSRGATGGWFWENRSGGVTSGTNWYGWYTPSGSLTYLWTGSSSIASINNSTGVYTALSDRNKKKDFEPSEIGLNEVMRLKPTLFRMLDDADDSAKKLGFIAQDVADVIPQAYVEHRALDAVGKDSVYIGLDDRPIIAALTKAIQEQQAMIQSLTDRITQLEAK